MSQIYNEFKELLAKEERLINEIQELIKKNKELEEEAKSEIDATLSSNLEFLKRRNLI